MALTCAVNFCSIHTYLHIYRNLSGSLLSNKLISKDEVTTNANHPMHVLLLVLFPSTYCTISTPAVPLHFPWAILIAVIFSQAVYTLKKRKICGVCKKLTGERG